MALLLGRPMSLTGGCLPIVVCQSARRQGSPRVHRKFRTNIARYYAKTTKCVFEHVVFRVWFVEVCCQLNIRKNYDNKYDLPDTALQLSMLDQLHSKNFDSETSAQVARRMSKISDNLTGVCPLSMP